MSEKLPLENRTQVFLSLDLPGQLPVVHLGTLYLVLDLWEEVKKLRAEIILLHEKLQQAELQEDKVV